jgi:predicted dehydrogenase
MTDILTAAVVGLGKAGSRFDEEPGRTVPWSHAGAYLALADRFRIVGAADPDAANAERFRARCPDVPVHPDAEALLAAVSPDVVSICTPAGRHRADLEAALASPSVKAVWCEKPLATSFADAEAMVKAAAARNVPLLVTYNRRWLPLWQRVRELIGNGTIGDLVCLRIAAPNRLYSIGSHALDLLRFLAGDPRTITSLGLPQFAESGEPCAAALFGLPSGAYAILQVTGFRAQLVIEAEAIGRKGRITVREDSSRLTIERFGRHPEYEGYQRLAAAGEGRYASLAQVSVFVAAARELAAAARDPSTALTSDGASALATQQLIQSVALTAGYG